jgi:gliding motility-associated-like protein
VQEIEVSPRFVSTTLTTDSFDNLFCVGEEVLIAADVTGAEGDDVTYTWFVNGVAQTDQNQAQFVHEIGSDTSNPNLDVIALSVNVGGDCVAETVEVELDRYPLDNCIIPEGMSPDGVNHTLDLRFLAARSGIRSLEIFNRFGRSVFSQSNYTDEFTGQNQNGTKLVTGTYFYVIKFNQEDPVYGREHKGWIYINREQQ